MKRFFTLMKNELKLNIRDMNMVIFALIMPLAVIIVLGLIYGSKPSSEGAQYTFLEQSFGAVCAVSICAGGLMGLPLVVSDYREKKFSSGSRQLPQAPGFCWERSLRSICFTAPFRSSPLPLRHTYREQTLAALF